MYAIALIGASNHWLNFHFYQEISQFFLVKSVKTIKLSSCQMIEVVEDQDEDKWLKMVRHFLYQLQEIALESNMKFIVPIQANQIFSGGVYKEIEGYIHKLSHVQGVFIPHVCIAAIKKNYPKGCKIGVLKKDPNNCIYSQLLQENNFEAITINVSEIQSITEKTLDYCKVIIAAEWAEKLMDNTFQGDAQYHPLIIDPAKILVEYVASKFFP